MKITYDELGRVSEVTFAEGEDSVEGFKFAENVVKDYNAKMLEGNKYIADKNTEVNLHAMNMNMRAMELNTATMLFNAQTQQLLKPCKVDDDPNKNIELTT